ncbi:MAG: hypothetical protein WC356_03445 [Candidatus Micrarchaeia archaeon]|jgi:hypothetical protein
MKKIIEGKKYDTDTAKLIGENSNGGSWNDFRHFEEELYQKKTGEFFLHGKGGPMTKYSRQVEQNSTSGSEKIIPLSFQEAREWVESHMEAEEYENLFGKIEEDESKTIVTLYLTRGLIERLRRESQEKGVGLSALIESKLG